MLRILGQGERFCDGVTRRSFLSLGSLALGGLSLPQILEAESRLGGARPDSNSHSNSNPHKATIMIFLAGGPPHQDMFDLKPDAPREIRGELNPIKTSERPLRETTVSRRHLVDPGYDPLPEMI